MRRWAAILAAPFVIFGGCRRQPAEAPAPVRPAIGAPVRPPAACILCYHSIAKRPRSPYEVSLKDFTRQMDWIARNRYRVIPLEKLVERLALHRALPESTVAITFDDGYQSVYQHAWPVLRDRKFPLTLFLYPGFIGNGRAALTWGQVKLMADSGVAIGAHSLTHPKLTRRGGMDAAAYRNWVRGELTGPIEIFQKRLRRRVDLLAYPYGLFDTAVESLALSAGYRACFTVNGGVNDANSALGSLDRVIVSRKLTLGQFKRILDRYRIDLADVWPAQGEEITAGAVEVIRARVRNMRDIRRRSLRLTVTGRAKGKAVIDTITGLAEYRLSKPLKPGFHEAVITARTLSGKQCEGRWLFLVR